jgi:predicted RNA-binding protein YlxR (DUF448 family)
MRKGSAGVEQLRRRPDAGGPRHVGARAEPTKDLCGVPVDDREAYPPPDRAFARRDGRLRPDAQGGRRGAYLCGQPACLDRRVRRRSIQRALKVTDAAAADAAVEALRNRVLSEQVAPASRHPRSSDDKEVRSG